MFIIILLLLAGDEVGYRNLVRLATAAQLEGYYYKPRIDKELLEQHKEGLIALSGCLASEIPDLILQEQMDRARATIDWFKQMFGSERFYLELQNHSIPEQAKVNRPVDSVGAASSASNSSRPTTCITSNASIRMPTIASSASAPKANWRTTKRMRYVREQFYLRSAEEMKARFGEVPEAVRNTLEVAEKCNVEIEFGKLHYPVFDPPEHFTREGYLRQLLADGVAQALRDPRPRGRGRVCGRGH